MDPVRPDYAGASVTRIVPALLGIEDASWLPAPVAEASSAVLLVVDGLGWTALERNRDRLPALASLEGGAATTTVPSTTATALTSIATGRPPTEHGVLGYRMLVEGGVLNVLRWTVPNARPPDPERIQPVAPFDGRPVPVVTRAEFRDSGFTRAHLRAGTFTPSHAPSDIPVRCRTLVAEGQPFVYAYYDRLDVVGHMYGLEDAYFGAELTSVDRLVGDLLHALSDDTALVVTSDHGHVHFHELVELDPLSGMVSAYAGDGRFRSLHAKPGAADDLHEAAVELVADRGWVFSRRELLDDGWLGPRAPAADVAQRLGDVVLAARDPIFFTDPTNPGEKTMLSGHGSLTPDEMLVPLLASRGRV